MSLPKYDSRDRYLQNLFYSEVKRQLLEIKKIQDKQDRVRKFSRLKIEMYKAIKEDEKRRASEKNIIIDLLNKIKQVIFYLINRIVKRK